jgi:hypothetical protein
MSVKFAVRGSVVGGVPSPRGFEDTKAMSRGVEAPRPQPNRRRRV